MTAPADRAGAERTPEEAHTPEARMGHHLRGLRHARGLTLKQLAARAELSHPFLSQLERGLARPSMTSLARIAQALGTSSVELLAASRPRSNAERQPTIVRAGDGIEGPYGHGTARLLARGPRRFEPLEVRGSNTTAEGFHVHAEDEFVTVIEGTIVVDLAEHGDNALAPGDSIYIRSGTPHHWRSADGSTYRVLVVKELVGTHVDSDADGILTTPERSPRR